MSQILITRLLEDALPLASILKQKGLEPLVVPLSTIQFFPLSPLNSPQGIIITSKNAIRAIGSIEEMKHLPLYGVGDETVRLAYQFGYRNAFSASGDGKELLDFIQKYADPENGILYHLSGDIIKIDIVQELQRMGFLAKREIVYSLQAVNEFPDLLIKSLRTHLVSYILFFSYQTAKTFMIFIEKNKLDHIASQMVALCLSQNVAQAIQSVRWKKIWISPQPNQESMLEYFDGKQ